MSLTLLPRRLPLLRANPFRLYSTSPAPPTTRPRRMPKPVDPPPPSFLALLDFLAVPKPAESAVPPLVAVALSHLNAPGLIANALDYWAECVEEKGQGGEGKALEVVRAREGLSGKEAKQIELALRMREAVFMSWPLVGFPKTIVSLSTLSYHLERTSPTLSSHLTSIERSLSPPPAHADPTSPPPLWNAVYSAHSPAVTAHLSHAHPSLPSSAFQHIYASILSRPGVLAPEEASLLAFASCLAVGTPAQAKGHWVGSGNLAGPERRREVAQAVYAVNQWAGAAVPRDQVPFMEGVEDYKGRWTEREQKPRL